MRDIGKTIAAAFGQKHLPILGEGRSEVVVEELSTRTVQLGLQVTCYNLSGHHVSGEELDGQKLKEYKGVKLNSVFTINYNVLTAMSSLKFAATRAAFGKYDVAHIRVKVPAVMSWLPRLMGKRVVVTIHGDRVTLCTNICTVFFI